MPKRRWLRYSIRTLMLAVTIFCIWLGWNVVIVKERRAVRAVILERAGSVINDTDDMLKPRAVWIGPPPDEPRVHSWSGSEPRTYPWIRRALGEESVRYIFVSAISLDLEQRIRRAFPEATVVPEGS